MPSSRCISWGPLVLAVCLLCGCFSTSHTVGDGPHGGEVRVHRTWYMGWGFFPLGSLDSREVVGGGDDYRISTRIGVGDFIINMFTGPLGFFRFSTLIEK